MTDQQITEMIQACRCPGSVYEGANYAPFRPFCIDGEYTCDAGTSQALCRRCWKENDERFAKGDDKND